MITHRNQHILSSFIKAIADASKTIRYNAQYMDHKLRVENNEINFMPALTHPTLRIVLRPNEFAVTRAAHPNPAKSHATNVILARGTEYGTILLFGRENAYHVNETTGVVVGPIPRFHATMSFLFAAARFFKRKGIKFDLQDCEQQLIDWVFSPDFRTDLAEQAKIDVAEGHRLGDGMVAKPPYKKPAAKGAPSNDAKFERREGKAERREFNKNAQATGKRSRDRRQPEQRVLVREAKSA